MQLKVSFIITNFLMIWQLAIGQKSQSIVNQYTLNIGFSQNKIYDSRLAAKAKTYRTPKFGFTAIKQNEKRRTSFAIEYTGTFKKAPLDLLQFVFINPEVSFSYERRLGSSWIGGFFNSNTLLNFPRSSTSEFKNNPISYTVVKSIGPSLSYNRSLNNELWLTSSIQMALVNYLIRPAYAHPYPEDFLKAEHFNPSQKGMAKSFYKSGNLVSINKYQKIKIILGLKYQLNTHLQIGLNCQFDYERNTLRHNSQIESTDLLFSISYLN